MQKFGQNVYVVECLIIELDRIEAKRMVADSRIVSWVSRTNWKDGSLMSPFDVLGDWSPAIRSDCLSRWASNA
jgi:hypothetical protein